MTGNKEAITRWKCEACGEVSDQDELLVAPNPFDPGDTIIGCPQCRSVEGFREACASMGCPHASTSGTPDLFGYRYLWLCVEHSPASAHAKPFVHREAE